MPPLPESPTRNNPPPLPATIDAKSESKKDQSTDEQKSNVVTILEQYRNQITKVLVLQIQHFTFLVTTRIENNQRSSCV